MDLNKLKDELTKFEGSAAQITVLVVTLALYLLTHSAIFAILVAVEFVAFVGLEVQQGIANNGIKHEFMDTLKSLGIALLIWLSFSFILGTSVPISAVVSCSMLPNLQRGDLVIIRGAQAASLDAPQLYISQPELVQIASFNTKTVSIYGNRTVKGSLFMYCMQSSFYGDDYCTNFRNHPESFSDVRGQLSFNYGHCSRITAGALTKPEDTPCIVSVSFKGSTYVMNQSRQIIVYGPNSGDLFAQTGDIIHRAQIELVSGNSTYTLTKGDNNNIFDVQFYDYGNNVGNTPVLPSGIKGAHVFTVPYIGYFKLFLFGFVSPGPYCDSSLSAAK